ncbi:MAG: hypothetical protein VBE63_25850 [Lamprobacter sp.]|uniref:hypothetical protein n=1 Tax=Lamprobacter sp. TaxID=3100796 RepID=UPI002B25A44F|nr:hypothetical protein [Lamprobacter sp.]MEA3643332.1 hypothetical protein [Lamprobacter sp.]
MTAQETPTIATNDHGLIERLAVLPARQLARSWVRTNGAKVVAKYASKAAGKTVARTAASPYLLLADAAELATRQMMDQYQEDLQLTRRVSKGVGFGASVGIGAAVGGPIGAGVGATVWALGEAIEATWEGGARLSAADQCDQRSE